MGVSIDVYRNRIGTFNSCSIINRKNQSSATTSTTSLASWARRIAMLLTFTACFTLFAVAAHHAAGSKTRVQLSLPQHPPPCPSCSSSSGQWSRVLCWELEDHFFLHYSLWPPPWPPPRQPPGPPQYQPPATSTSIGHVPGKAHLLDTVSWITAKKRNSITRMTHGNRKEKGIKIIHWNKGPSYLENKYNEIETIIDGHRPHVLGLSEANLREDHDQANVQFRDYQLHTALPLHNHNSKVSRIVVYTHNSLVVKRRLDLEDDNISSIWLEIGLPRKRKILMCHAYREWKHLYQVDSSSGSIQAQLGRWTQLLNQWERALSEDKEVILAMDANIDFLKWTSDKLSSNDNTHRLKPLIEELFSSIFPQGVSQMVTSPTRAWPGQPVSGLDHLYTNRPNKLSAVYTEYTGGSDHKLIKVTRYSKSIQQNSRYVRKRCYKNFDEEEFKQKVKLV